MVVRVTLEPISRMMLMAPMADSDGSALEALWRSRLNDARLRVEFARNFVKEIQSDFGERTSPDGTYALERALRAERRARREYERIQAILVELVMDGRLPDDDAWPFHRAAGEEE